MTETCQRRDVWSKVCAMGSGACIVWHAACRRVGKSGSAAFDIPTQKHSDVVYKLESTACTNFLKQHYHYHSGRHLQKRTLSDPATYERCKSAID